MNSSLRIAIVLLLVVAAASCSSMRRAAPPDDDEPIRSAIVSEYEASFDDVWAAVAEVVSKMPIEVLNETQGVVVTGYLYDAGDTDYTYSTSSLGTGWVEAARYRLEIHVVALPELESRVSVTAHIECKYSTTSKDGKRYREGAWFPYTSTGELEQDVQRRVALQLGES